MKSPHCYEGMIRTHLFEIEVLRLYLLIHFLSLDRSISCISIFRLVMRDDKAAYNFFRFVFMFPFMISTLIHDGYDGAYIL